MSALGAPLGVTVLRLGVICVTLLSAAPSQVVAVEADASKLAQLIATQTGELPIILSAPHGGLAMVPDTPPRKGDGIPKGPRGFYTGRDIGTEELCYEVAAQLATRLKKKPYFVIAKFHRRYIDPNRPAEIAYEDPDAKPVYEAYHHALTNFCRDVQQTHHRGLLLDIHGQGFARDTVFRGTQNGKTVTLLRERFGEPAHNGSQSLFGLLRQHGWKAHPEGDGKEQSGYNGGYIVKTYGSHQGYGIDAIQLEFGSDYRAPAQRHQTAATLCQAIESYAKLYLQMPSNNAPAAKAQPAGTTR